MSEANRRQLMEEIDGAVAAFSSIPSDGLGAYLRIEACLTALVTIADVFYNNLDKNPYPRLSEMASRISGIARFFGETVPHLALDSGGVGADRDLDAKTRELFETAWTVYDPKTYDHSVTLIESRLGESGFKSEFFKGKRCFDGGCGTGRFSVAMAQAGAREVVAADIGADSIAYLKTVCERTGIDQIKGVVQDVTDLSAFETGSFDFVASHVVLHHTPHPDRGIAEHFRITRSGGVFWLYLYGADGIYWSIYDKLKRLLDGIEPPRIRQILTAFRVRQGLIYTFLDNFLAPRVYYRLDQVLDLLKPLGAFTYVFAKGTSSIDDNAKLLATPWGRELMGPDGEIRLVITKQ